MKRLLMTAAAFCALLVAPSLAEAAARGVATANVNMRSGPSTGYPAVTVIPVGAPVTIYGCMSSVNWCDVSFTGGRGWVSGRYVTTTYRSNRVYVEPDYYQGLGIPMVTFDVDTYWDRHYRSRDFYRDRDRWRRPGDWNRVDRRPPPPPPRWDRDDRRPPPGWDRDRDRDRGNDRGNWDRDRGNDRGNWDRDRGNGRGNWDRDRGNDRGPQRGDDRDRGNDRGDRGNDRGDRGPQRGDDRVQPPIVDRAPDRDRGGDRGNDRGGDRGERRNQDQGGVNQDNRRRGCEVVNAC